MTALCSTSGRPVICDIGALLNLKVWSDCLLPAGNLNSNRWILKRLSSSGKEKYMLSLNSYEGKVRSGNNLGPSQSFFKKWFSAPPQPYRPIIDEDSLWLPVSWRGPTKRQQNMNKPPILHAAVGIWFAHLLLPPHTHHVENKCCPCDNIDQGTISHSNEVLILLHSCCLSPTVSLSWITEHQKWFV